MQSDNNHFSQNREQVLISPYPGVTVALSTDAGPDYLAMRAAQLSALNHVLTSGDFAAWSDTIQADAKWLAATLAEEVSLLVKSVTIRDNLE